MRAGLVVLLAGLIVLLGALGMVLLRLPDVSAEALPPGSTSTAPVQPGTRVAAILMIVGMVLVVTLIAAAYVLFRVTRRFTLATPSRQGAPTPTDDIWVRHNVPDDRAGPGDDDD